MGKWTEHKMGESKLVLHTGGSVVDFDQVRAVRTPDATATWQPVPHDTLVGQFLSALEPSGLRVVDSVHSLYGDGLRYFGLFGLANGKPESESDDYQLVVGVRNSHDMSAPAAFVIGSRVFVCDNLAFSGEVRIARKHTRRIMGDLPGLALKAMDQLVGLRGLQGQRIEAYKGREIGDKEADHLIVRACLQGAATPSTLGKIAMEWRNPRHEEFRSRTLWSLFNSFTEIGRDSGFNALAARTPKLHGIFDLEAGLALPSIRVDAEAEGADIQSSVAV